MDIQRADIIFIGIMGAGLLAALALQARGVALPDVEKIPNVLLNVNPQMHGTLGPARDANNPLRRSHDTVVSTVADNWS